MSEEQLPLSGLSAALYTHADVAGMVGILTSSLAGLLPPGMVTVERQRSVADRMRGRPGTPTSVQTRLGDRELSLRTGPDGSAEATVSHVVRGVRLSSEPVELAEWIALLAGDLQRLAAQDERTRDAVQRFLLD